MKVTSATIAFVAAAGMVAFGQATQQNPTTTQSPTTQTPTQTQPATPRAASAAGQQVTYTGCIVSESDFRRAQGAGGGGVAGTGVGAGNEFILTDASMAGSASAAAGNAGAANSATGTSGRQMAFELTGSGEGQAAQHVGQRVEVMGMVKEAATNAAGTPTGGVTDRVPGSSDLELREFEVTSVKAATGGAPCMPAR